MTMPVLQLFQFKLAHVSAVWNVIEKFKNSQANLQNDLQPFATSTPIKKTQSQNMRNGQTSRPSTPTTPTTIRTVTSKSTPVNTSNVTKKRCLNSSPFSSPSTSKRRPDPESPVASSSVRKSRSAASPLFVTIPKRLPAYLQHLKREGDYAYVRIDVIKTLEMHPDGKRLLKGMRNGLFTKADRSEWCRILVTEMHRLINSWFPHATAKLHLAMDITNQFPLLRAFTGKPWENYFNGQTGHIVTALNGQRSASQARMRNRTRPQTHDEEVFQSSKQFSGTAAVFDEHLVESNDPEEEGLVNSGKSANVESKLSKDELIKVRTAQLLPDTEANKKEITSLLRETFTVRRNLLKEEAQVRQILDLFPKLLSYNGEMVNEEFQMMGYNCNEFLGKFSLNIENQIIAYASKFSAELVQKMSGISNKTVKALALLAHLSPKGNCRMGARKPASKGKQEAGSNAFKKSTDVPHPALIQIVPGSTNVETYCSKVTQRGGPGSRIKTCAPYLLWVTDDKVSGNFYLKAEHFTMPCPRNVLQAFLLLLKFQFILDVAYHKDLVPFWDIIEFICGMKEQLSKTQDEFLMLLRNVSS